MIRLGKPPYLECSSKGDKRFSPFFAKVNGKSIEEQYQAAKIFEDGSTGLTWREAKGRRATNMKECAILFEKLWRKYISEHPYLLLVLKSASGLSDIFAQRGCVNQAEVLWRIRNETVNNTHNVNNTHSVAIDNSSIDDKGSSKKNSRNGQMEIEDAWRL